MHPGHFHLLSSSMPPSLLLHAHILPQLGVHPVLDLSWTIVSLHHPLDLLKELSNLSLGRSALTGHDLVPVTTSLQQPVESPTLLLYVLLDWQASSLVDINEHCQSVSELITN